MFNSATRQENMAISIIKGLTYKDYDSNAFSFTAGTVGTYATYQDIDVSVNGKTPILVGVTSVGHSSAYFPVISLNGNTARIRVYRSTTSADSYTTGEIKIRVWYL